MADSERLMESYYAARAPEYDRVYSKPERQADLRAMEQWVPSRLKGARVLEIACGTGYWTQFIAPVAREVVALDASSEVLSIARGRVREGSVEFQVGDAYALPQRAGMDAAFAGFWFSHVPKSRQREFLVGLNAALRPGATVVMLDNLYVEGSSTPVTEHDADGNGYQVRKLDDGSTHRVLKNFPSESELRSLVLGLGEPAAYMTWDHYWAFEYRAK
ncbi:MAG: methyltransferase domain-containing protein [Betaproteobacteria bacterium]